MLVQSRRTRPTPPEPATNGAVARETPYAATSGKRGPRVKPCQEALPRLPAVPPRYRPLGQESPRQVRVLRAVGRTPAGRSWQAASSPSATT